MIRFFFWANVAGCAAQSYYVFFGIDGAKPLSLFLAVLAAFVAGRLSAAIELERME